jgi:hypothetical protein
LNVSEAQKALKEAPGAIIDDRPIRIEQANVNRTLFVKFHSTSVSYNEAVKALETFVSWLLPHLLPMKLNLIYRDPLRI